MMPSYVNIGAYVDEGTMIDTWATVGSCAQIGKEVHLSGGVGIGGVLEPVQAAPVIVEDHCFIGSRCIIVEEMCIRDRRTPVRLYISCVPDVPSETLTKRYLPVSPSSKPS